MIVSKSRKWSNLPHFLKRDSWRFTKKCYIYDCQQMLHEHHATPHFYVFAVALIWVKNMRTTYHSQLQTFCLHCTNLRLHLTLRRGIHAFKTFIRNWVPRFLMFSGLCSHGHNITSLHDVFVTISKWPQSSTVSTVC